MLADNEIINVIKEYEREYAILRKDSDAFCKRLAMKFLNISDDDREQVFDFFLREIESNKNDLCGTALMVIKEMRAVELCPYIVGIYNNISECKDDEWKKIVVFVLMELRYLPAKDLYRGYVLEYTSRNEDSFYLLVQYCNVSPVEALPLLSNEFVEKILSERLMLQPPEKTGNSLQGLNLLIAYLIACFKNNSNDCLPQLLELIYIKNPKAAIFLKDAIVNYLKGEFVKFSYSKSWLDNEITNLNNLVLFYSILRI